MKYYIDEYIKHTDLARAEGSMSHTSAITLAKVLLGPNRGLKVTVRMGSMPATSLGYFNPARYEIVFNREQPRIRPLTVIHEVAHAMLYESLEYRGMHQHGPAHAALVDMLADAYRKGQLTRYR